MAHARSTRPTRRRIAARRVGAAGVLVAAASIAAAVGHRPPEPSTSKATAPPAASSAAARAVTRAGPRGFRRAPRLPLGEADGAVRDGTTVFDGEIPGVANLDPELHAALRQAAADASGDGVELVVDSGWRSPEYQEQLLRQAILKYGSRREAARWVATPDTSAHVSGEAVDMGRSASSWLSEHGAAYGLCRIYANEPWHFELRAGAIDHGCPPMYADAAHDPRTTSASVTRIPGG